MLSALTFLLAATATGIQFGWEPLATGGNKYVVQVEPELIDVFRKEGFSSDVPPQLRDIRRIEIRVGDGPLPHQSEVSVLKVPDISAKPPVADATQKPKLDATQKPKLDTVPPDLGSKPPVATEEPKVAVNPFAPGLLPNAAPANPLPDSRPKTAAPASFQASERPAPRSDDGPSGAGATPDRQHTNSDARPAATSNAADSPSTVDPEKPWLPFLGALGALVISAAGNLYLGWVHLGTRRRYHEVVNQLRETDVPIAITPHPER